MTVVAKLNKFFDIELRSDIKDILITCDKNGRYSLFGEYTIIPNNGYFDVRSQNVRENFSTIKNAIAYVTLHHAGKYFEAKRMCYLDLSLCSINVDIEVHRNLLKKKIDDNSKLIYTIKIQEDTIKKRNIIKEIQSYINSSITIQMTRFDLTNKFKNYKKLINSSST